MKCEVKFQENLVKLNEKASDAGIGCRFVDNGNSITDYDTGLQWVETNSGDGVMDFNNPQDADNTYTWSSSVPAANGTAFTDYLWRLNACNTDDGTTTVFAGFAARCDWRLPTPAELQTILLAPSPCGTSPCIDPIFGSTAANVYWSSTTDATFPQNAWGLSFNNGFAIDFVKTSPYHVRAVRGGCDRSPATRIQLDCRASRGERAKPERTPNSIGGGRSSAG